MSGWRSFLEKKGVPESKGPEGPMTNILILLDRVNCRDLVAAARGFTGDVLFMAMGSEIALEIADDLQFAFRAADDFVNNSTLAILVIKNKGIVLVRKSFFLECEEFLSATSPGGLFEELRKFSTQRGMELKLASEDNYDLMKCGEAFIDRDYAACAKVGGRDFAYLRNSTALLLTLIALQRLHRESDAAMLATKIEQDYASNAWLQVLLRLVTGKIQGPQALQSARNEEERYQAHFYAGARLNTLGKVRAAREEFAHCPPRTSGLESCLVDSEVDEPPG